MTTPETANEIMHSTTEVTKERAEKQIDFILLDASSSMAGPRWDQALMAVDQYVRDLGEEKVPTTIEMAYFYKSGSFGFNLCRSSTPDQWQTVATDETLTCLGTTPLYDAINSMMRHLRDQQPSKCAITIFTDGEENASVTNVDQAKALLDWARRKGWQITFVGCDFENSRQARALGADAQNTIGLDAKRLSDATSSLAKKRQYYDQFGAPMGFTDTEKKDLGGYLTDQSK